MAEPENEEAVSSHKRRLMRSLERRREIAEITAKDIVVVRAGTDRFSVATDSRLNSGTGRPVEDLKPIFGGRLVKRVFDVLPEGSFLHSNCCHDDGTPLVAETMAIRPAEMRYGNTFVCCGLAVRSFMSTATSKPIVWI